MQERGEAPDIVHAHVFSAGFIALLLSRISRGRYAVVVSEHNSDFIEGRVTGRNALIAHVVFGQADVVCPVSRQLETRLEAFHTSGRYAVVQNVVDLEAFRPSTRSADRDSRLTRFLVVASLTRQKGLEYLLAAVSEVHQTRTDFTLDIVGDGPERHRLEQLAREHLPSGVLTFHGNRPRREVAKFMARSDVFVLASIVETFGVVVIEALAAGLPIITTSAFPDHERLAGRFGIVVPRCDVGALRDAMLTMLEKGWPTPHPGVDEFAHTYSAASVSRRWTEVYALAASL
jgi:glycosyltransferase involved in cell wall biosynthesis